MKIFVQSLLAKFGYRLVKQSYWDHLLPNAWAAQQHFNTVHAPIIFDIGAFTGDTAVKYRQYFPNATIHCFEPFPDSFEQLKRNTANDPQIHCYPFALAQTDGNATLYANAFAQTNSILPTAEHADRLWGANLFDTHSTVAVPTRTLDSVCAEYHISQIDILKIDTQGTEYAVLKGAQSLLERRAIKTIFVELILGKAYEGQRTFGEYLRLLEWHGFELLDHYEDARTERRWIQTDLLFRLAN